MNLGNTCFFNSVIQVCLVIFIVQIQHVECTCTLLRGSQSSDISCAIDIMSSPSINSPDVVGRGGGGGGTV